MIVGITFFSTLILLCSVFQDISANDSSTKLYNNRQKRESHEMMSAVIAANCMSYSKPPANKIGKLLIEILKNLEADHSTLTQNLVDSLNRSRFFVGPALNDEEIFDSLLKNTYYVANGEPLSTFPRVMSIIWLLITDPAVNRKYGWCLLNKITNYISAFPPADIAKKFAEQKHVLSRTRFVMEDFISENAALNAYWKPDVSVKREFSKVPLSTHKLVEEGTKKAVKSHNAHIEEFVVNDSFNQPMNVAQHGYDADETFSHIESKANSRVSFYLNMLLLNIIFIM